MEALLSDPFSLFLVFIWIFNIIFAFVIAYAAQRKGRSWAAFFWLTILVGPIIMGIIVATISPVRPTTVQVVNPNSDISQKITELASMRDKGLLTEAEFESKKRELLDKF